MMENAINMAKSITLAGETHPGYRRNKNEDCFVLFNPADADVALAVAADGIGGHANGEVASRICCCEMMKCALQTPFELWDEAFLKKIIISANQTIFKHNLEKNAKSAMGCTVVAALFLHDEIKAANVGDSRFYVYSDKLEQISVDHKPDARTWYLLTGENVPPEKLSRIISRSVGTGHEVEPQFYTIPRRSGQKYLLCTDGLSESVSFADMESLISSSADARDMCRKLMRKAILERAMDNVTVIAAAEKSMPECGRKDF